MCVCIAARVRHTHTHGPTVFYFVGAGPEWFLSFLLRALEAYRPLLLVLAGDLRPPASSAAIGEEEAQGGTGAGAGGGAGGWGGGGVDPLAYFARGLALLARSVRRVWFWSVSTVRICCCCDTRLK